MPLLASTMSASTVAESPLPVVQRPYPRTVGDAAAAMFRRRVKFIDRIARLIISVSGIGIICAVLGIGLFLVLEILPLFHGARLGPDVMQRAVMPRERAHLVIVDEHQEVAGVIGREPQLHLTPLLEDTPLSPVPFPGLEGQQISATVRLLRDPVVALGTTQGDLWFGTVDIQTVFDGARRRAQAVVEPEAMVQAVPGHRISALAYRHLGERTLVASIADGAYVIVTRITTQHPLVGPVRRAQESIAVPLDGLGRPVSVLLNEAGTQLLVGTDEGRMGRWHLPAQGLAQHIETVQVVPKAAVSAMAYVLGDRSVVVGGSDGSVATWSLVVDESQPDGFHLTRIHPFPSHAASITTISASPRDKQFLTASSDGIARLHYMTSERTLAQLQLESPAVATAITPKANGIFIVTADGTLHHWWMDNPHPEISWRTLFGKIWYEGYRQPEYVWQSTGGSDDFEPKLSLVPLAFGTLKGTLYALLFAVPLALLGALYCSQFLDRRLRNPVKSTVELMAALPSVVLGFVAGVLLASLVQGHIVAVLVMPILIIPLVAIGGLLCCSQIPRAPIKAFVKQHEFWVLTAWISVGVFVAGWMGPWIERLAFHGDFEAWLLQATGMRYDQRNALVVGWAMGFAVIPIIFTICEDAFSSVPRHLVGASLACGASSWQTAWRVVLPAAGSGIFSAIMVGFGRAVGETMIVLMATGNTPITSWSLFNGFRALSANIAVEIPEAPHGGTLYRVLFVAALLLFAMTSVVNTIAEVIRLRLRKQLHGI